MATQPQAQPQPTTPGNNVAFRKRTQIAKTNKMMLLWIAGSSVIIGAAIVVAFYLGQKLIYNERILAEKQKTISTLQSNIAVAPKLQTAVRALDVNAALATSKAKPDDQTIQVILDALPSDANSPALGASLQNKLLAGIDGLEVDSMQVDSVQGIESLSNNQQSDDQTASSDKAEEITFQFAVTGNQKALKQVLTKLERSIRTIDILSLRIESRGPNDQSMAVRARAFYVPAVDIKLYDKVVKP